MRLLTPESAAESVESAAPAAAEVRRARWQLVEAICDQALELDADARSSFVAAQCGADADVRADVDALLAADEDASGFLTDGPGVRLRTAADDRALADERLTSALAPGSAPAETSASDDSEPVTPASVSAEASTPAETSNDSDGNELLAAVGVGHAPLEERAIGPYQIERMLGEGGMGRVYLARRCDDEFEREVAIKVLRTGLNRAGLVRRFRDERQILASLDHPGIAKLYEGGTLGDGRPYLVMEYISGHRIDDYADARALSVRQRVALFRRVCEAVQYAHQSLIVHLDLKPSNILVTDAGDVKLLDFGIAKLLDAEGLGAGAHSTWTGPRPLTPAYASPEQLTGGALTTASDVYSLGVLLHQLLTDQAPPARAPLALLAGAELDPKDAALSVPSRAAPPARRRELRGDLDSIVSAALLSDPDQRYASAAQLAADLGDFLDGRPVKARRGSMSYRAGKFLRRHWLGVATAATLAVLVVGFAITATVQAERLAQQSQRAERERESAERVLAFLTTLFEAADPFQSIDSATTAKELLDRGSARVGGEFAGQPAVQARLRDTLGEIYYNLGDYEQAEALLTAAVAQRETLFGDDALPVAESLTKLASVYLFRGAYEQAEAYYRRALDIREAHLAPIDPYHMDLAEALHNLGTLYFFKNQPDQAIPVLERALRIAEHRARVDPEAGQLSSAHSRDTAFIMKALGAIHRRQGNYAEAERLALAVLERFQAYHQREHIDVAYAWNDLGVLYMDMQSYERAREHLERGAAIAARALGPEHPHLGTIWRNLGRHARSRGALDEATEHYRRSLAILEAAYPPEHPELCNLARDLIAVLRERGQDDQVAALRERFPPTALVRCARPQGP